jgi:squalene-associated FAD-dependent desaturase
VTGALRAVVIGGGLAGITAGLDLADAGVDVTVLEGRPRLGGATSSFRRGTLPVDTGQHVFLRCCSAYRGLLDRLGVTDRTVLQERLDVPVLVTGEAGTRPARLIRGRRSGALPPPLHLATALLGYRALPLRDRLGAVRAALALGRLDPSDPEVDAQSFGAWLAAHGQRPAAVQALWRLLTVATLNAEPDDASLALAATVVRTGLLESAGGADIGWSAVPLGELHGTAGAEALTAAGAQVRTSHRVSALRSVAGRWSVAVAPARGDGYEIDAELVVLATPADAAAALLPAAAGIDPSGLRALGAAPIVNIHVVYDRPVLTEPFVAVVGSPVQWIFDRSAATGRPRGTYLALSQSAADRWVDRPAAELTAEFTAELARLLPAAAQAQVLDAFVTRERAATFRPAPGQATLRPGAGTLLPGLAVAGAWTDTGWPATMEGAVRSGHAAVAHLLRSSSSGGARSGPRSSQGVAA